MENKKMRAEHPKKELAVDILYDIIGSILFGAGIYTFAEGGNFAPGGISGIALIMNKLWNLPVGTMTLILNIPLVIYLFALHPLGTVRPEQYLQCQKHQFKIQPHRIILDIC